ncbi:MAG TPA: hypothetical protein VF627_09525, partial [Abditibacterium sp.]
MHITMTDKDGEAFLRRLRFPAQIEKAFQENYYWRVRTTMRFSLLMMAGISVLSLVSPLFSSSAGQASAAEIAAFGIVVALNFLLLFLSRRLDFPRLWQPLIVATTVVSTAAPMLHGSASTAPFVSLYLLLILSRAQRLQLRWMALQVLGIAVVGAVSILFRSSDPWAKVLGMLFSTPFLMSITLLLTRKHERYERSEFWAKHVLAQERNDERHKREQTEQMLHVLSQAIGGIVHDLGNPLTAVQSGAETLLMFVKDGDPDRETVQEFAEIISDGAQMLNYLRLSLMEQTRVLEGKPVPIEPKPTSLLHMVRAGTQ